LIDTFSRCAACEVAPGGDPIATMSAILAFARA
jgi:hypothetical protein